MKNLEQELLHSTELFERSQKVSPGGVHSPVRSFKGIGRPPVFFKRANGSKLFDIEGNSYIDYCMSFGPLILGHLDLDVKKAVHEMVDTAWTFGACEPYSLELAEWMCSHLKHVQKVRFVSSGTEAVMSALRVARAATGRSKVLKFEGCYHGHVDSLLVKAGSGLAGTSASSSAGVSAHVASETLTVHLDDENAVQKIFDQHRNEIAAIIIEPLPANNGLLPQRVEFLKFLREICTVNKSLLIFDEVISGFRVGLGGMVERTGIIPDLVCYGKVIGGGFPVGCYGGRDDLMTQVAPLGSVYQAGTLSANPIGMKAGLVSLNKMKSLNGWAALEEKSKYLQKSVNAIFENSKLALKCEEMGSLFWIRSVEAGNNQILRRISEIPQDQSSKFNSLFLSLLTHGIYLAPNAYEVGFLSLAHTHEDLDRTIEAFEVWAHKIKSY